MGAVNLACTGPDSPTKWPTISWGVTSATSQGMNYDSLASFSAELESGDLGYIDGMLVIRNGMIIFEKEYTNDYDSLFNSTNTEPGKYNYYDPNWHPYYNKTRLHTMQSVSKSITAAAVGIALKNGKIQGLDAKIMDYFDGYESSTPDPKRDAMTIRDVLTMTTGIQWDESSMPYTDSTSNCVQMEKSTDWIQYIIDQPMAFEPGEKYEYNSGATMLLSYLINKTTGQDLTDYVETNLFDILGITDYYWKHTPKGLTDAEGGLYLTPRDIAKFGYLYLHNGKWDGKQVLPENWVDITRTKPVDTASPWFKYSFQWWLMTYGDNHTALLASGLGGQRMIILPELNIVAVFTGWNIYEMPALNSWMAMNKIINAVDVEMNHNPKLFILAIYFSILLGIGFFASKRITNISDYYVGGKRLGYWIAALSARSTGESGWLLIGVTGMGALMGVSAMWIVVGEIIGVFFSWQFMAKKFKRMTDEYNSITIPDFLVSHFKSSTHTIRILAATALSLFVVIYVSAQIDITGKTFESFLGFNYYTGIAIGFGIVVLYIFSGGFLAVAWSDFFQGSLMFAGLILLPIVAYISLSSDASIINGLYALDPALLNIWGPGGFNWVNFATVTGLVSIGIGFMGSPQVYVRFIAIKSEDEVERGKWVAIFYTLLTDTAAVMIGILGRYMLTKTGQDPEAVLGTAGENVLAMLLNHVMPTVIIGIYIAAVLSAVMSTVDSLLVVASSAVTRDFYQQILHPDIKGKNLIRLSRIITIALACCALVVALTVSILSPDRTIFWFVIFGWSGIAATFCPVIILSLFWPNYTEKGAIASMVTGFLCVPIFKFIAPAMDGIGIYFDKLDVMLPSVLLAMIAGYIVSKTINS
ncbi:MAG: sodium/solute symporter [Candidatus Neomarinimicrobiota bacterium]|nr:sodium/solute symporter [Candidatus Neomarinimicrobiota bacterium]